MTSGMKGLKKLVFLAAIAALPIAHAHAQGQAQRAGKFEDRETLAINFEGAVMTYFRRYRPYVEQVGDDVIGHADFGRDPVTITLDIDVEAKKYVLTVECAEHDPRYPQKWIANLINIMGSN